MEVFQPRLYVIHYRTMDIYQKVKLNHRHLFCISKWTCITHVKFIHLGQIKPLSWSSEFHVIQHLSLFHGLHASVAAIYNYLGVTINPKQIRFSVRLMQSCIVCQVCNSHLICVENGVESHDIGVIIFDKCAFKIRSIIHCLVPYLLTMGRQLAPLQQLMSWSHGIVQKQVWLYNQGLFVVVWPNLVADLVWPGRKGGCRLYAIHTI